MKRSSILALIVLISILVSIPLVGCTQVDQREALKQKALEWGVTLEKLQTSPEGVTIQQIEAFLEPSVARSQRAKEFRDGWTAQPISSSGSVNDVIISEDGIHGSVRYSSVEEYEGVKKVLTEITQWILIDGIWYRTNQPSEQIYE